MAAFRMGSLGLTAVSMLGGVLAAITFLTIALSTRAIVLLTVFTVAGSTVAIRTGTLFHGRGVLGRYNVSSNLMILPNKTQARVKNLPLQKA